jgi:hypothetical protein
LVLLLNETSATTCDTMLPGAGRAMDFGTDGPEQIAAAIADEIGRDVQYRKVDAGGAARAAASIGELL